MLTGLKLSNFRIFDDEVEVRFRPITVLIGRNSSGKSSIIKFLLMLQQSMDPAKPQFLTVEGDKVNLGIFSKLKNSLTKKRRLTFELAAKRVPNQPDKVFVSLLGLPDDVDGHQLVYKANAAVPYNERATTGRATYSVVDGMSGRTLLRASSSALNGSTFGHPELPAFDLSQEPDEESRNQFQKLLHRVMVESQLTSALRYHIDSLRHLLPVRNESQRVILVSQPPVDNVGQKGEYSLPHLQRIIDENGDLCEFIMLHLRNVVDIESVKFEKSLGYISQAFAKSRTTGAKVLIADYGFGVSQCLPVFVQGAIMPPRTTLMVEQPEAQLHPTAQLELGSFFADLWNKRKVGSIVETHSDNILLRLRRLIAKGELSHQEVSVAFFTFDEQQGNAPVIKNLDINEDGSMQPGLPMEFFGADVLEGLQLGARA